MDRAKGSLRHLGRAIPLSICLGMVVAQSGARAETGVVEAVTLGKPLIDLRLRYETVEQDTRPKDADAVTLRARLGYETGALYGFSGLAEFDLVQRIGGESFNDTINGKTSYPVVADPEMVVLNRLQLSYGAKLTAAAGDKPDLKITLGRQRILVGNQRFVGNVGWRQHEQTFDGVSIVSTSLPKTALTYAYIAQVNRIFGPESAQGHLDGDSHLIDVVYAGFAPYVKLEAFAYLLDFVQARAASTATFGFRGESGYDFTPVLRGIVNASYARQDDYRKNPLSISLSYWLAEGGLKYKGFTALAGYEVLGGNGTVGFSTPLATLHAFQGWADTFLTTPADGIKDFYVKASYSLSAQPVLKKITATLVYHDFEAERTGADYGNEWDALVEAKVDDHITVGLKYAGYNGSGPYPDKTVGWVYAGYKF